jgi:hypothetical protein
MGATLTGDLEKGEVVSLEFPLPLSPYPVRVRAIVRYREGLCRRSPPKADMTQISEAMSGCILART